MLLVSAEKRLLRLRSPARRRVSVLVPPRAARCATADRGALVLLELLGDLGRAVDALHGRTTHLAQEGPSDTRGGSSRVRTVEPRARTHPCARCCSLRYTGSLISGSVSSAGSGSSGPSSGSDAGAGTAGAGATAWTSSTATATTGAASATGAADCSAAAAGSAAAAAFFFFFCAQGCKGGGGRGGDGGGRPCSLVHTGGARVSDDRSGTCAMRRGCAACTRMLTFLGSLGGGLGGRGPACGLGPCRLGLG